MDRRDSKSVSRRERLLAEMQTHDHPIQPDQEWANAWTHGLASIVWLVVGFMLLQRAERIDADSAGLVSATAMYVASALAVFVSSTLSHVFLSPPWLGRFRAADQACIYLMIVGTYTPIAYAFAAESVRWLLMISMWTAASIGFVAKLILSHRIDSISVVSYLILGWAPAIPLIRRVPMGLAITMLAGGVVYSGGVWFLLRDRRKKYFHAAWHAMVIAASLVHAYGIAVYVLGV